MSDYIETVLVEDAADFRLLSMANEKRRFAIVAGEPVSRSIQMGFERGIDARWFDLVDIQLDPWNHIVKSFRLTDAGLARLTELAALLEARQ